MASKELISAAIDFGTTYSGWSVLFEHNFVTDPTKGLAKEWYSDSGTLSTNKTPTVVLIKPDGSTLEAFGYEAENRYKELVEGGQAGTFYYFRRFKMMLMKKLGEKITDDIELRDEMGRCLPAKTVFTLAIEYLVKDVCSTVNSKVSGGIHMSDIKWVITVPAIWTDPAKKFMRLAAEKAGISSDKLLIALEPECASIFCRHLSLDKRLDKTGVNVCSFPVGTKYMIIDAGGGTVDITVHEIHKSGALKEITAASGGGWGGMFVDQAFEEMLTDLVGKTVYQNFKKQSTEDWLDLWRDFELKKRNFSGSLVTIKVPLLLLKLYHEEHKIELSEHIASSSYSNSITLMLDKMKCEGSLWEQLYDMSITNTIRHVKELLSKKGVEGVKTLIMVGGFSESPLLQERIKDAFSADDYQVVIPQDAASAVLRGAPIFGFKPECIFERVLRYTYGFEMFGTFIQGKHPESRRKMTDRGIICEGCFDKHVEIGQSVTTGDRQTSMSYFPTSKNDKYLSFALYFSNLKDPKYTNEGCWYLESFDVLFTDHTGDLNRKVLVSLTFSGTEIEAEGIEENTGIVTKAKFRLPV